MQSRSIRRSAQPTCAIAWRGAAAQLNFAKLPELLRKPWSLNKNGASGA